jgi:iron complex transport system substrate-binding protein
MFAGSLKDRAAWVGGLVVAAVVSVVFIGCSRDSAPVPGVSADQAGHRYVSFAPSMTQMLIDLGESDRIVAVGEYDPVKPVQAAVVGDLYRIDYEKLLSLRPTDVFMQPGKQGVPARLQELATKHGWKLHAFEIETRDDALRVLGETIGPAIGDPAAAQKLRHTVERQWDQLAKLTATEPRPGCLLVVGRNPVVCAGPQTFISQMLEAAGGRNVLSDAGVRYPVIDREKMLALRPEVIVWIRAGVSGDVGEPRAALGLPDGLEARVIVVDDAAALLPSTSMPRVIAQMARALHPKLTPGIDDVMSGGRS